MFESPQRVDLVLLGPARGMEWPMGEVRSIAPSPDVICEYLGAAAQLPPGSAILLWDPELGEPSAGLVRHLLGQSGDVWHAGLALGTGGIPAMMDFVHPAWMFNRDPDPRIEATSWRISLRACLLRSEVVRTLGGTRAGFETMEAAGLELGHRYIQHGVIVRHIPDLLQSGAPSSSPPARTLPCADELRFVMYRFGPRWTAWAALRGFLTGSVSRGALLWDWVRIGKTSRPSDPGPYRTVVESRTEDRNVQVSVLIPTLNRYDYLRTLLDQLRVQTLPPAEVIIVDQTPRELRENGLAADYPDLPIRMLHVDRPGQCTARNAGLQVATGEYVLLADDDIEIGPSFIEDHVATIEAFKADSSSGIAREIGAPAAVPDVAVIRMSNVFPAGITLIRRAMLERTGLFDLAYDNAPRADGDLGMRFYLAGARMVLNPNICVLHHHAETGGLRSHGARVVTRAKSRATVRHRHLPAASEVYYARRYFSARQVHESRLLRILGTFSLHGHPIRRIAKVLLGLLALPHTLFAVRLRAREADEMLTRFPQIPAYVCSSKRASDDDRLDGTAAEHMQPSARTPARLERQGTL